MKLLVTNTPRAASKLVALIAFTGLLSGCQQVMSHEPYYRPLEPSTFFPDGRSARPLIEGTVSRGNLHTDVELYEGKRTTTPDAVYAATILGSGTTPLGAAIQVVAQPAPEYVDRFPFPITEEVMRRGQHRFNIYCSVCHDRQGTGRGMIVQRGYTQPPSYITDDSRGYARRGVKLLLRDAPVGYFYNVISHGYGAMADYSAQVEPRDRWAIIAYMRALQFSQYAPLQDLPEQDRKQAETAPRRDGS